MLVKLQLFIFLLYCLADLSSSFLLTQVLPFSLHSFHLNSTVTLHPFSAFRTSVLVPIFLWFFPELGDWGHQSIRTEWTSFSTAMSLLQHLTRNPPRNTTPQTNKNARSIQNVTACYILLGHKKGKKKINLWKRQLEVQTSKFNVFPNKFIMFITLKQE